MKSETYQGACNDVLTMRSPMRFAARLNFARRPRRQGILDTSFLFSIFFIPEIFAQIKYSIGLNGRNSLTKNKATGTTQSLIVALQ